MSKCVRRSAQCAVPFLGLWVAGCFVSDDEIQSKIDGDGDNVPLGEDCAPSDRAFSQVVEWYADVDGDGYGAGGLLSGCESLRPTTNTADNADDCDDSNPSAYPGADERYYDGVDQDCAGVDADGNGSNDDYDQDADGFEVDVDCDDTDAALKPDESLEEVHYDGVDNDCNLATGDGDKDGDGYWSANYYGKAPGSELSPPIGMDGDCYDDVDNPEGEISSLNGFPAPRAQEVYPGSAAEIPYDGVDSACDGDDAEFDADGDGEPSMVYSDRSGALGSDCQDCTRPCSGEPEWASSVDSADINPSATETWYDGVDQDCQEIDQNRDGVEDDFDVDFDGAVAAGYVDRFSNVGGDCIDTDSASYPGAPDAWYDGVDSDCGGEDDYDADSDGFVPNEYFGLSTAGLPPDAGLLDPGDCVDDPAFDSLASGTAHWAEKFNPGEPEQWYDGYDYDCAGDDDYDQDADGHRAESVGTGTSLATFQQYVEVVSGGGVASDDCDDTDSGVSPAQVEVGSNGKDDDCDGAAAPEGIEGENNTAEHSSGLILGTGEAGFGVRMATGDLNSDGMTDIVTAEMYDGYVVSNGGRVSWFDGDDVLNQSTTDAGFVSAFVGTTASTYLGSALVVADVDGDGFDDIIAGGDGYTDTAAGDGAVYIFQGTFSGTSSAQSIFGTGAADVTVLGASQMELGFSLAAADWSGDGIDDLIVGAPGYESGSTPRNAGALVEVNVAGVAGEVQAIDGTIVYGAGSGDYLGFVHTMSRGDINGDGADDLVTGSSVSDRVATLGGAAFIVSLPMIDGATIDDVLLSEVQTSGSYDFCGHVSAVGDLNGDGYDEVAIGCPGYSGGTGAVGVFYGAATPDPDPSMFDADLFVHGDFSQMASTGSSVALGDLSGDGVPDLVVGEPDYMVASSRVGEGGVAYFDGASLSSGTWGTTGADGHVLGVTSGSDLGAAVAIAADMDADGDAELLVSADKTNSTGLADGELFLFTGGAW